MKNIYFTLMFYASLLVNPYKSGSVHCGMFDALIEMVKNAAQAVIDFLFAIVGVVTDFIRAVVVNFFDFIVSIFSFLWSIFQWFKNETLAVLYNLFKEFIAGLNIPFPSSLSDNLIQWYHQINIFFPCDTAIDLGIILINTWLFVLSVKIGFKIKLLIGGLIAKPLFK